MDIAVVYSNSDGVFDWQIGQGDLLSTNDLGTAVAISLFTDAVADSSWQPPGGSGLMVDRKGWWADAYNPQPLGSQLWRLSSQAVSNQQDLIAQATGMCNQALSWLTQNKVAASYTVAVTLPTSSRMQITVVVTDFMGNTSELSWVWNPTPQLLTTT